MFVFISVGDYNGVSAQAVERSHDDSDKMPWDGCKAVEGSGVSATSCYCDYDLCNAATTVRTSTVLSVAAATITLAIINRI